MQSGISPYNNTSSPQGTDGDEDSQAHQGNFGNVPDEKKRKSFFQNKNYIRTQTDLNQDSQDQSMSHEFYDESGTPINQLSKKNIQKARKSLYVQKQIMQQLQKEYEQQLQLEAKEEALKLEKQRFPQLLIQQNNNNNFATQHRISSNTSIQTASLANGGGIGGGLEIPNQQNFRDPSILNNNSDTNSIYQHRRISAQSPNGNQFEDYFETEQHIQSANNFNWLFKQQTIQLQPYQLTQQNQIPQISFPMARARQGSFQNIQLDHKLPSPKNQSIPEFGSINNIMTSITNTQIIPQNKDPNNINNMNSGNNNVITTSSYHTNTSNMNTNQMHKSPNYNSLIRGDTLLGTSYQKALYPTQVQTINELHSISHEHHEDDTINTKTQERSMEKRRRVDQNIFSHLNQNTQNSSYQNKHDFYIILLFDQMKQYTYYFPHNNVQHILKTFKKKQQKEIRTRKQRMKSQFHQNKLSKFPKMKQ